MILAIETATNVCSVAFRNNREATFEKRIEQRGSHSEQLFLFIQELMEEHQFAIADLEALLISEGPGSYTGLRISASAVKGLLFQTDIPLFGINTLASFAVQATKEVPEKNATIHSILDARRKHLYYQAFEYKNSTIEIDRGIEVLAIQKVEQLLQKGDVIVGTGINRIEKDFLTGLQILGPQVISAKTLIQIYRNGQNKFLTGVTPETYDPKYYTSNQA